MGHSEPYTVPRTFPDIEEKSGRDLRAPGVEIPAFDRTCRRNITPTRTD